MAKIKKISIKNFRGIKDLAIDFNDKNLICLIGRGDSGKTTILEAISIALSSSWNLSFYDTDFHNCDFKNPIDIQISITDFPDKLLSEEKFGLHVRSLNIKTHQIFDEMSQDDSDDIIPVLTIKLTVDRTLEPIWTVTNSREQEEKRISATDRASLNCFMVSDHFDRHFYWNKGNPLYSLLNSQGAQEVPSENNVVLDSLRQAKKKIDASPFSELAEVTNLVKKQAAVFGLDISETRTTLDFKELSIKDGRISLHENAIPFRQMGKGSKRLASFAIQSALGDNGSIMLVDEIEQGLEPDRIKQLIRTLKENQPSQIFLTTHSREVVTELDASSLFLILKDSNSSKTEARSLDANNEELQKAVRACPEAFFAKKVIVCEGATEIGICRALDKWRISRGQEQMSFKDCAYVDGTGNNLVKRTREIQQAGIRTALLCDSDDSSVNTEKLSLKNLEVRIFDCEPEKCIEQQIFSDLPWEGVKKLLQYVQSYSLDSFNNAFAKNKEIAIDDWEEDDGLRNEIISVFKTKKGGKGGKKWFKTIHGGEVLGDIVFKHINETDKESCLRNTLTSISDWIDS
jgi:putative ATP-dependent endonuclease of the OLD family